MWFRRAAEVAADPPLFLSSPRLFAPPDASFEEDDIDMIAPPADFLFSFFRFRSSSFLLRLSSADCTAAAALPDDELDFLLA